MQEFYKKVKKQFFIQTGYNFYIVGMLLGRTGVIVGWLMKLGFCRNTCNKPVAFSIILYSQKL